MAALLAFAVGPGHAGASMTLAHEAHEMKVSAYGGLAIWSSYNRHTKRYRLRALANGRVTMLPVPSDPGRFDADLGPSSRGGVTAVYSRCLGAGRCDCTTGTGHCDLYGYDFRSRRETKLQHVSRSTTSEYAPSIWRDKIAFARSDRHGARGPKIVVTSAKKPFRERVLSGGSRGSNDNRATAGDLDLRGSRLAFGWHSDSPRCSISPEETQATLLTEIWLVKAATRHVVARTCSNQDPTFVTSPSLSASSLTYFRGGTQNQLTTLDLRTGLAAESPAGRYVSLASDGPDLYYVVADPSADPPAHTWSVVKAGRGEPPTS